ncbi:MAG TPA: TonB-dependent receptor [Syntrophales bacterium]|nr:TonB-dependent receptor [Syntrophales bacterium]
MDFRRTVSAALMAVLFVAGEAWGESPKDSPAAFTLGDVVVTAERLDDYVKNYPQNVEVVERREIAKRNLLSVEEVLKTISGVEVYSAAGIGSRISIRGSGKTGGVLVLLNGRPLNSNQHGNLDLNAIPVDSVQSVSVFKPPVPVWLGAGASDGAIHIVTRSLTAEARKKEALSTVKLNAGSFGFAETSLSQRLEAAGGNALLSAALKRRDGKRANSDRTDGSFGLNWSREKEAGGRYEVNGRYYEAEYGTPGPTDNLTPDARQLYRKGSLDARYAGLMGDNGTFTVNLYGDGTHMRDRAQSGLTYALDDRKLGLKADTTLSEPDGLWDLRMGGISEWDDFSHTLAGGHHRLRNGLSGQVDRRFGVLTGTLGVRGDVTNDFGFSPGLSAGLGWGATPKCLIKVRAGYSANLPSFEQLYQTTHGSIDQTRGNPDLKEERIWSYDVGIEYKFQKDRLVQATLFRADTGDLIAYRRGTDLIYRPVNIARAEREGIELTGKYGWNTGVSAEINLILQRSENGDTGKALPYTPEVKAKGTLQYALPALKTRLEGSVRYEGVRFSQTENLSSQQLDGYVTVDLKATQPLTIHGVSADWYVRIDNLFDAAFESHYGYPDDGIRFVTGLQMRF